jgi:hypothetical protein
MLTLVRLSRGTVRSTVSRFGPAKARRHTSRMSQTKLGVLRILIAIVIASYVPMIKVVPLASKAIHFERLVPPRGERRPFVALSSSSYIGDISTMLPFCIPSTLLR